MNQLPELLKECKFVPEEKVKCEFPGKSAKFIYHSGSLMYLKSKQSLKRCIEFRSKTNDSLFDKFCILGYANNRIRINISFSKPDIVYNKNVNDIQEYFKQYDIVLEWIDINNFYITNGATQLRNMFNILAENNEIPSEYFEQIRDIIVNCNDEQYYTKSETNFLV